MAEDPPLLYGSISFGTAVLKNKIGAVLFLVTESVLQICQQSTDTSLLFLI